MSQPVLAATAGDALDDVFVFHDRPLRDGVALADTARFADHSWPLGPATLQKQERGLVLHFDTVPARYRLALKRVCYVALSGQLPPGGTRPAVNSVLGIFYRARTFLTWLENRRARPPRTTPSAIRDVTAADLLDYQRHLLTTFRRPAYRAGHRAAVRYFWRYRHALDGDALTFDPRDVDGWAEQVGRPATENATDRIPEHVHGPLLVWALRFVDDFSEDILTAVDRWHQLRGTTNAHSRVGPGRNSGLAEDLRGYLDAHVRDQQPLPGYNGRPNILAIAREVRCGTKSLERFHADIEATAARVGISSYAHLNNAIAGTLDGQPWVSDIGVEPRQDNSISVLSQMLQAACYIVIAFLSGMRDSEVKHLRRGCVSVLRDTNGNPYRWRVHGLAFKGETDPSGAPATWVVGEPAARAIAILERMHPNGVDWLFAAVRVGPGAGSAGRGGNMTLTLAGTNRQLNRFVVWINDYCAGTGRLDGLPTVGGRRWQLTTRQFRRTLSWFIARRSGGVIAGALQYRHHSIQMFEGYAGTSESGFRAEVEAEEALARGERLLAMIDRHDHTQLAGPAAAEAARRLDEMGKRARYQGITITDRKQLQRLMKRDDPVIYPGHYATCVYDHTKALCRQRVKLNGHAEPDLAGCRPLDCRNVALTEDNLASWHTELESVDRELAARPLLPPLLRELLQGRRDEITAFIDTDRQETQ
jgi:hypothetical protein